MAAGRKGNMSHWTPKAGQILRSIASGKVFELQEYDSGRWKVSDKGFPLTTIDINTKFNLVNDPNEEQLLSVDKIRKALHHYCSEQNCNNGRCELVSVCRKCPVTHRMELENSVLAIRFLADWKSKQEKPIELEKVWVIRIIEGEPGEITSQNKPVAEKMVRDQLDGADDSFFKEFLKDKAEFGKTYFMTTDIVAMAKE